MFLSDYLFGCFHTAACAVVFQIRISHPDSASWLSKKTDFDYSGETVLSPFLPKVLKVGGYDAGWVLWKQKLSLILIGLGYCGMLTGYRYLQKGREEFGLDTRRRQTV